MNRQEKEECVIRLYKENKSTREIAKLTHMSFRDIGSITKKVKLESGEKGPLVFPIVSVVYQRMDYTS
jgi:hypothetical protein